MRLINSFWTIIIMAVSISLALISFFFFHSYKPAVEQTKFLNDLADAQEREANKMTTAKNNVKMAIALVNERTAVWDRYVATRTPATTVAAGGIDLSVSPLQLVTDTARFRDSIQRSVNDQLKKGGVKVLEPAPYVQATIDPNFTGNLLSSFYHYPDFAFPVVIFDFGTVRVQGTYDQIMRNVRSYKTMPHYLAVTDGLRFDGTSPLLTGSYQLSIVGFIRAKKIHGALPEAAGGGTANGFGGAGAFGAAGLPPGMPPGMGVNLPPSATGGGGNVRTGRIQK